MDRPPSDPGEQYPRDHTGPPRERDPRTPPEPGYTNPDPYHRGHPDPPGQRNPYQAPASGYTDPDPYAPHADLYRPHHGDPAVPADSMPTEPIPVLRLPGWDSGNARYEGSWSDWVARASADPAEPEAAAVDPGVPPPAVDTPPPPGAAPATEPPSRPRPSR